MRFFIVLLFLLLLLPGDSLFISADSEFSPHACPLEIFNIFDNFLLTSDRSERSHFLQSDHPPLRTTQNPSVPSLYLPAN